MRVHQPFFSVIIASYNRAALLKRALRSLVQQTEEDWEAIIVDDGSTDDTHSQVLPFLHRDKRIKYISKLHSGEVLSKNEGIYASIGKVITFLDSDDEYRPEHLKQRKDILLENPDVKFLYGGLEVIGSPYVPDRFDYSKKIHLKHCVAGGTFFMERNTLLSLNGLNEIPMGADDDLFARAKKAGVEMKETNIATYIYHRETLDSITNNV